MKHTAIATLFRSTVLVWITLASSVSAQTPDTTDAARYYPLQFGNVWEYRGFGLQPGDFRVEIVGDTVIAGVHYQVEASASYFNGELGTYSSRPVRFDTAMGHVLVRGSGGTEFVWQQSGSCPLSAPFGNVGCDDGQVDIEGGYDEEFELFWGQVLDGITLKSFHATTRSLFIADIGWGGYDLVVEPGGTRLSYARIDGVEYGTPFPVASESAPAQSGLALAVYPNPVTDHATVRFSLDRSQRATLSVFDVLGRRVRSADLGVQPAGEASHWLDLSGLAPGLYVVRLSGDAGATATARVVRR